MTETTGQTTAAPSPHPRLRDLSFFVGTWDAPGLFHETPFFPRSETTKRITATSEEAGFWFVVLIEELPNETNPVPFTSRYVWGHDAETDEFVADWYGSNGGRAVQRSIGWNGDTLVFEGTMSVLGHSFGLRDTFTRTGDDSFHHLGEINLGPGWIAADEQDATRIG